MAAAPVEQRFGRNVAQGDAAGDPRASRALALGRRLRQAERDIEEGEEEEVKVGCGEVNSADDVGDSLRYRRMLEVRRVRDGGKAQTGRALVDEGGRLAQMRSFRGFGLTRRRLLMVQVLRRRGRRRCR